VFAAAPNGADGVDTLRVMAGCDASTFFRSEVKMLAHDREGNCGDIDAAIQQLVDVGITRYCLYPCSNRLMLDGDTVWFCFVSQHQVYIFSPTTFYFGCTALYSALFFFSLRLYMHLEKFMS
jgi:hypothetical protein